MTELREEIGEVRYAIAGAAYGLALFQGRTADRLDKPETKIGF